MNKLAIMTEMNKAFYKVSFTAKKYSPEILVVAGIVGGVTSAVLACRATLKVQDVLAESKEVIDQIHDCAADQGLIESGRYSEEEARKDLMIQYTRTGLQVARMYAPAVVLGSLSIGCMITSHNILQKRNLALAAAYATMERGFKEYRGRVLERFGDAVDKELLYGVKAEKIEETVTDPETGKKKKVKKTVEVIDELSSPYAKFFDETSRYYERNPQYNMMFLTGRQQYLNDKLRAQGYLFLNDVYQELGFEPTKAGQVVGWIYDPASDGHGDNYVDLGIYSVNRKKNQDFIDGYEPSVILDFNVAGNILNRVVLEDI